MSRFLTFLIALQMYLVKLTNSLTDFCYRCCKNCRLVIEFFLGHSKHEYLAQAHQNSLRKNKQQILNTTSQEPQLRNGLVTLIDKRILIMRLAIPENRKKPNQSISILPFERSRHGSVWPCSRSHVRPSYEGFYRNFFLLKARSRGRRDHMINRFIA